MKRLQFLLLLCLLLWAPKVKSEAKTPSVKAEAIRSDKRMTIAQKRQLFTFVQDVVSVGIERDFKKGAISNRELVRFGIYQTALRRIQVFQDLEGNKEGRARLASKHVTDAVAKFFGKRVRHQSFEDWKYKNGSYNGYYESFTLLDPQNIKWFRVEGIGTSHLTVYVGFRNLNTEPLNYDGDKDVKMTLKRILSQGRSHYILSSYKTLNKKFSR